MSRRGTGELRACVLALGMALVPAFSALGLGAGLTASLEPKEIALGESATLTVTVTGDSAAPRVPQVDGLEIQDAGRSTQIQIVNGSVSRSTSFLYEVRPLRAGSFTLPPVELDAAAGALSTGALALQVLPSGSAPRAVPTPEGAAQGELSLEIVRPAADLYVGQLEPVEIRLLVPEGVRITELEPPKLSGPGFTISRLTSEQPREERTIRSGVPMSIYRWSAAVSAVKPGPQTLSAEIDGSLVRRTAQRRARPSPFDDDFFAGSLLERFFGRVRQQPFHAASQPETLEVAALPEAGRPEDFSGAVGQFSLSARVSPQRTAAGDPVTLTLRVDGRGNFDRVQLPGLESGHGFKTYTPSSRFEGGDPTGYEGRKVFEQIIIPERADADAVPQQRFSYFDPEKRSYVTLASDAVTLAVSGPSPAPKLSPDTVEASLSATDVLPLRADLGALRRDATPLFRRPAYLGAAALPLAGLAAAACVAWVRRRQLQPARVRARAAEQVVRESLRRMDQALGRGDARAFHEASRRALQARLALRLEGSAANPAALTAADAARDLADDPSLAASVRRLLEEADAFAYAGRAPRAAELAAARERVVQTLHRLEVQS